MGYEEVIEDLASSHVAAPSLGHYASPSFVVKGRGRLQIDQRRKAVEN